MTVEAWQRLIAECAEFGVAMVQFIGGEPTLHPGLPTLIDHALTHGINVEVFSNLVHITDRLWDTFAQSGVRLACSYYSDDPAEHAQVTRRNTLAQTRKNIERALARAIPLRVGVIEILDEQRTVPAITGLRAMGVAEISTDRLRQVGRGIRAQLADLDQLCGQCGDGKVAIGPDGTVWPYVFSRWMPVGSVLETQLSDVLRGPAMASARAELSKAFSTPEGACAPKTMCNPTCPRSCGPACAPAGNCRPVGVCAPDYH